MMQVFDRSDPNPENDFLYFIEGRIDYYYGTIKRSRQIDRKYWCLMCEDSFDAKLKTCPTCKRKNIIVPTSKIPALCIKNLKEDFLKNFNNFYWNGMRNDITKRKPIIAWNKFKKKVEKWLKTTV